MSKAKKKKSLVPKADTEVATIAQELADVALVNVQILRARRRDAGITQEQMGYALGLSGDTVSKMESLKRPSPSLEQSIVWARLTGLNLRDYFEELAFQLRKLYPPK